MKLIVILFLSSLALSLSYHQEAMTELFSFSKIIHDIGHDVTHTTHQIGGDISKEAQQLGQQIASGSKDAINKVMAQVPGFTSQIQKIFKMSEPCALCASQKYTGLSSECPKCSIYKSVDMCDGCTVLKYLKYIPLELTGYGAALKGVEIGVSEAFCTLCGKSSAEETIELFSFSKIIHNIGHDVTKTTHQIGDDVSKEAEQLGKQIASGSQDAINKVMAQVPGFTSQVENIFKMSEPCALCASQKYTGLSSECPKCSVYKSADMCDGCTVLKYLKYIPLELTGYGAALKGVEIGLSEAFCTLCGNSASSETELFSLRKDIHHIGHDISHAAHKVGDKTKKIGKKIGSGSKDVISKIMEKVPGFKSDLVKIFKMSAPCALCVSQKYTGLSSECPKCKVYKSAKMCEGCKILKYLKYIPLQLTGFGAAVKGVEVGLDEAFCTLCGKSSASAQFTKFLEKPNKDQQCVVGMTCGEDGCGVGCCCCMQNRFSANCQMCPC